MRVSVYIGDGEWFCTYDVAKGGKICGGEGWSFSYGAIPSGQLGQLGGGKGLRILFHTGPRNGPAIDITYDNEPLLHTSLDWPRKVWVKVRIAYDTYDSPGGLILERDGHVDCRSLIVPNWSPQEDWQIAIAAHTGLAVDRHFFDNLTLTTDALIRQARVEVEVTLNGQQFTKDKMPLLYDSPPVISSYSPTSGPMAGDTKVIVHGFMFHHGLTYSCLFGNISVPALYNNTENRVATDPEWTFDGSGSEGTIICPSSPLIAPGEQRFAISLDHYADDERSSRVHAGPAEGDHVTTGNPLITNWYAHRDWYQWQDTTIFTVYEGLTVALQPTGGPIGGGTSILVQGDGLDTGSDYRCRYAELITTSDGPYPPNPTTVHCTSPWFYDSGSHGLQITLNGQQYSSALPFLVHDDPSIISLSPSSGPAEGGTDVVITGSRFTEFATQICSFGPQSKAHQTSLSYTSVTLYPSTASNLA